MSYYRTNITNRYFGIKIKSDNDSNTLTTTNLIYPVPSNAQIRDGAILCRIAFFPRSIEKNLSIGKEDYYDVIYTQIQKTHACTSVFYLC